MLRLFAAKGEVVAAEAEFDRVAEGGSAAGLPAPVVAIAIHFANRGIAAACTAPDDHSQALPAAQLIPIFQDSGENDSANRIKNRPPLPFKPFGRPIDQGHCRVAKTIVF